MQAIPLTFRENALAARAYRHIAGLFCRYGTAPPDGERDNGAMFSIRWPVRGRHIVGVR